MVWVGCYRAARVGRRRSSYSIFGFLVLALTGAGLLTAVPLAEALAQANVPGFRPGQEAREKLQPEVKVAPKLELFVPEATGVDIPKEMASIKVVITRLEVIGVTMFDSAELQPLTDKLLAIDMQTLGDLYRVAADITKLYREKGFVLSRALVPEQTIADGTARIRVVEGKISKIVVEAKPEKSEFLTSLNQRNVPLVESYLRRLTEQKTINVAEIERVMMLLNALPGIETTAVIRPDPGVTKGAEFVVQVSLTPSETEFGYDTGLSHFFQNDQFTASQSLNSVFGLGEKISVDWSRALSDRYRGVGVSGQIPVGTQGLTLSARGLRSRSKPGFTLEPFAIASTTRSMASELSFPLISGRLLSVDLFGSWVELQSDTDLGSQPLTRDLIRYLNVGSEIRYFDNFGGTSLGRITLDRTLAWGDTTGRGDGLSSRPEAKQAYPILHMDLIRRQSLFLPGLDMLLRASGQFTNEPVHAPLEFSVGSLEAGGLGRGYDPGEISGDRGVAGTVEVRYELARPEQTNSLVSNFDQLQLFAFWDSGWTENLDRAQDGTRTEDDSLASTGVGLRTSLFEFLSIESAVMKPLTRTPATQANNGPRLYLQVKTRF